MRTLSYLSPLPPDPAGVRGGSPLPPDPPVTVPGESPLPTGSGQALGAAGRASSDDGKNGPER